MSAWTDGGPAFVVTQDPERERCDPGMSKRDWFAGQALAGLLANPSGPVQANCLNGWDLVNCTPEKVARLCGEMADAMLAERSKSE